MYEDSVTLLEWEALIHLSKRIGESPVRAALLTLKDEELRDFCQKALADQIQSLQSQPRSSTGHSRSIKLDTSTYQGNEGEAILRWFVEIETAMSARDIIDPSRQVAYAMSRLAGRAKSWAYGRRLADPICFPDYASFKRDLRDAFEPPKTEFRTRTQFFSLTQGKRDILAYSQRARYLISCISEHPIDDHSQVVVFMKGLNDGPVRNELYRQFPSTLEAAITLALQEEFSLKQSQYRFGFTKPKAPGKFPTKTPSAPQPEPMDISAITTSNTRSNSGSRNERAKPPVDKSKIVCRRCWVKGHFPSECRAPAPVPRPPNTAPSTGTGSKNP